MDKPQRRVLLIAPYNSGTIASCTLNLWKALSSDTESEIKCIVKHKFSGGYAEFDNCIYYSDKAPQGGLKNLTSMFSQIRWLRKQKKDFKPDLTISALTSCSALNVLTGGKDKKIGIFHSPHQQAKAKGRVSYLFTLLYYNFLFPFLDKLFCVSEEVQDSILQAFRQISSEKVSVVYNAHNIEGIRRTSLKEITDDFEKKIFSKQVYLYVGRFDENKAPERAVKAFAQVFGSGDEQLVFIGGDEKYREKLIRIASESNIIDRVHFLGHKTNPYMYMARSKALISCSFSEGLPGVIIEATILGIPVISTNSSKGVWEILSCSKDYVADMRDNFVSTFGIITPNNLSESENIRRLAYAMKNVSDGTFVMSDHNPFIEKVTYSAISNIYCNE